MLSKLAVLVALTGLSLSLPVPSLPSAPPLGSKMHSGYITVDAQSDRQLFYFFVESASLTPATAPVILWLNGGPGCSSLGGLLSENGPYFAQSSGLTLNPNSWHLQAHVIYLESPAGVGFSFSRNASDYTVGDARTARDSVAFLNGFFDQFPQFLTNEFYVAGESYGGHYVPGLALAVVKFNAGASRKINIRGHLVGNAWTHAAIDNAGCIDMWEGHALISSETADEVRLTCDFGQIGPLMARVTTADPTRCTAALNRATQERGSINIYQIYETLCNGDNFGNAQGKRLLEHIARSEAPHGTRELAKSLLSASRGRVDVRSSSSSAPSPVPNPLAPNCADSYLSAYLNRKDVQQAINVDGPVDWHMCSPVLNYSYTDLLSSMVPTYIELMDYAATNDYRALVYSGDVDGIVPQPGTRHWIRSEMPLNLTRPWAPWVVDGNVAGYVTVYNGGKFSFATVRGAGHMVPGTQPRRASEMLRRYLAGGVQ